ncbi:MAG: roadblock/LC7 domain-containing protein [Anaerolineae bacterium]|nr:roadblock/LC7 domain-containing protein [Anaerolineae bacterium]
MMTIYRSEALGAVLKSLADGVTGVHSAVILSFEGLLVESYPFDGSADHHANPTSSPQVAALASVMAGLSRRTLESLAQGSLQRLLVQGQEGVLIIYPCGRNFLAVLVENGTRLAPVIVQMNAKTPQLRAILEG